LKAKFEIEFLDQAIDFIDKLDQKSRDKIIYNLDKSRYVNDPKLFKKLDDEIWEFRTKYSGKQFRLLAFWVKTKGKTSLVIATNGFVKKVSKVPKSEIKKANNLRTKYIEKS
jgi:phage-related protein